MPETTHSFRGAYAVFALLCGILTSTCQAAKVKLAWEPSSDPGIVGYSIYYGEPLRKKFKRVDVGNDASSVIVDGLNPGKTYGIFITAISAIGVESEPSNVLLHLVPASAAAVATQPPPGPQLPQVNNLPATLNLRAGKPLELDAVATGDGLSFQWRRNGIPIPDATGTSYSVPNFTADLAGTYDVVVSDAAGSTTSSSTQVGIVQPVALVNGSFESAFYGWSVSGDQLVAAGLATDGTSAAFFDSTAGSLSQTLATVAGQAYVLQFDVGSVSSQPNQRRVTVRVDGQAQLLSQTFKDAVDAGTGGQWVSHSVQFVADRDTTTLSFENASVPKGAKNLFYLLLDNVRLTEAD